MGGDLALSLGGDEKNYLTKFPKDLNYLGKNIDITEILVMHSTFSEILTLLKKKFDFSTRNFLMTFSDQPRTLPHMQ